VESGISRVIISIDGTTQEVYQQYRVGGQLTKVLEGTKRLADWKKKLKSATPHIIFQFLVVKPNEHQLDEVKVLAKELGVDEVKFKTAQVYDYAQGNPLIPTLDRYSRYRQKADGSWEHKSKLLNHCWKLWHAAVITWDGIVVPCCFDKDAEYRMGNVGSQTFDQVWNGPGYRRFREAIVRSRGEIDMCTNCTEGVSVFS
jgi:radical SAM protein with 4Fe4S-binding SPASM domain